MRRCCQAATSRHGGVHPRRRRSAGWLRGGGRGCDGLVWFQPRSSVCLAIGLLGAVGTLLSLDHVCQSLLLQTVEVCGAGAAWSCVGSVPGSLGRSIWRTVVKRVWLDDALGFVDGVN